MLHWSVPPVDLLVCYFVRQSRFGLTLLQAPAAAKASPSASLRGRLSLENALEDKNVYQGRLSTAIL
jgi:hypothetical protein